MERSLITALCRQVFDEGMYSIIDSMQDVVYWLDPHGRVQFISDEITKFGYTPGECIGKNILDLVHPDDREKARFRISERRRGERKTRSCEIRFIVQRGGQGAVGDSAEVFRVTAEGIYSIDDNNEKRFLGTLGVARRIGLDENEGRALAHDDERIFAIFDTLHDGYYETDIRGTFIFVNRSFCRITGYDAADFQGRHFSMLVLGKHDGEIAAAIREIAADRSKPRFFNWELQRGDGKKRYVEVSVSPVIGPDGQATGYRGIVRDVTDRKRLEEEILVARKIEAIGIMAGGIAHDYNNALTAVLGNLSLAKMEAGEENRELLEVLNDAEKASLRVLELTKRLSNFAKGGKPNMIRATRDILMDLIGDTAQSVLDNFQGTWDVTAQDDLDAVDIDTVQFSHVIGHVLTNALESVTPNGRIEIELSNVLVDSEKTFNEITLHPDRYVLVLVRDNGCGIPEDLMYKIFDPYFSTKEMASGMGLAISYAVIKRHHGYIEVSPGPGGGTEVYCYLPAVVEGNDDSRRQEKNQAGAG
ncbi:MAG: PAS domain S-box protein [Spirochaetes bacterium]|nr:PAS domain S-box protein [Spirochaetota bacterium]